MASSPWLLKYVAVALCLALKATPGEAGFNCTRTGCNNFGVCDIGGLCTCVGSTFTGFDCSQDHRYIMHGACLANNPCQNGGTCYDVSGMTRCYCPYEFYGPHCQLPTVQNECFSDQMIINVNPVSSNPGSSMFVGRVGIQHGTQLCELATVSSQIQFSLDPVRSQWQGFAAILPFHSTIPCGAGPKALPMGAEMTYTYDVIVRYGGQPELDEVITFSCTVPYMVGAVPGPTAVLFSVADAQGISVDRPRLGSSITITFKVDPTSIFTDVAVKSCSVYNDMKTMSKAVVVNSCPVQPFGESLVKQGDKHVLTLRVHKFAHDLSLTFDCSVKVCTIADYTCQQLPVCPPPGVNSIGTSDILGLLMPSGSGRSSATFLLNDLLGPADLSSLLGTGSSSGTGTGAPSAGGGGDLSAALSSLLGTNSINDLLLSSSSGGGTTGGTMTYAAGRRRRRRSDVIGHVISARDINNVITLRGLL